MTFSGLGKNSVFGSVYGGITAQCNNSQLLQKMHKKSEKVDDSVKPFPDSVTQWVAVQISIIFYNNSHGHATHWKRGEISSHAKLSFSSIFQLLLQEPILLPGPVFIVGLIKPIICASSRPSKSAENGSESSKLDRLLVQICLQFQHGKLQKH